MRVFFFGGSQGCGCNLLNTVLQRNRGRSWSGWMCLLLNDLEGVLQKGAVQYDLVCVCIYVVLVGGLSTYYIKIT